MATYNGNSLTGTEMFMEGDVVEFAYSGNTKSIVLPVGEVLLECWGAQGGSNYNINNGTLLASGGKGGYCYGHLSLEENTLVYVNVGGAGKDRVATASNSGGFNGGGNSSKGASGGGATDFRVGSNSLEARVIVAGAGGGAGTGAAGGGGDGYGIGASGTTGTGGTLTSGGSKNGKGEEYIGTFGKGGPGDYAAGGAGWYGGGGTSSVNTSAGGGSGYYWSAATASAINKGDCSLTTKYYLTSTGHTFATQSGNGTARITFISVKRTYFLVNDNSSVKYFVPSSNSWKVI